MEQTHKQSYTRQLQRCGLANFVSPQSSVSGEMKIRQDRGLSHFYALEACTHPYTCQRNHILDNCLNKHRFRINRIGQRHGVNPHSTHRRLHETHSPSPREPSTSCCSAGARSTARPACSPPAPAASFRSTRRASPASSARSRSGGAPARCSRCPRSGTSCSCGGCCTARAR